MDVEDLIMTRKELLANLKRLNINNAIADKHAMADNSPAILLRWHGDEHFYTGFGASFDDPPEIEKTGHPTRPLEVVCAG